MAGCVVPNLRQPRRIVAGAYFGVAGWTGFGPGASGSIAGFGSVGVTEAPAAFAAPAVSEYWAFAGASTTGLFQGPWSTSSRPTIPATEIAKQSPSGWSV